MEEMVAESVKYTILGMGVVFLFLYIMVVLLEWQRRIVWRFWPQEQTKPVSAPSHRSGEIEKKREIAAAMGAIEHYRRSQGEA